MNIVPAITKLTFTRAGDFMAELSPWGTGFSKSSERSWIYRGVGAEEYRLIPSAFRMQTKLLHYSGERFVTVKRPKVVTWQEQAQMELDTFRRFVQVADREGLQVPWDGEEFRNSLFPHQGVVNCSWWPPNHLLPGLALCQHYGLPTRLLDWSYSIYVAAYFAAVDAKKLLNARKSHLTPEVKVWAMNDPRSAPFAERLYWLNGRGGEDMRLWRVEIPSVGNQRLQAQQGLFTLFDGGMSDWRMGKEAVDSRSLEDLYEAGLSPHLKCYTLVANEAEALLQMLKGVGVSAASMLTGFEGIAREVDMEMEHATRHLWARPD